MSLHRVITKFMPIDTVTATFCPGDCVKFSPYFLIYNSIEEKFHTKVSARDIVGYL